MKSATFILAAVCIFSSYAGGRNTAQSGTKGGKDNTVFSWLSTCTVLQTVAY